MIMGNKHKCWYCSNNEPCTADHFYPKSKGGVIKVYACSVCQGSKKDRMPLDWLKYINRHIAIKDDAKIRIQKSVVSLNKLCMGEVTMSYQDIQYSKLRTKNR